MKTGIGVRRWFVALLLVGPLGSLQAASFSAELVDTERGEIRTGTFACQDRSYRVELPEKGSALIIVGDAKSGLTRLLVPTEKVFLEAGPDDPRSALLSPFACYAVFSRKHGVRNEGTETVAGVRCTKQVVASGEQVFVIAWFSEELGLPLKIEIPVFSHVVELRAIKRGPQDAALFTTPSDYKPAPVADEEPPPAWAAQVPGAPEAKPPFHQRLSEGKILRIRPQAGRQIQLEATKGPGAVTAVGFKAGRPTSSPNGNTFNVDADSVATMTFSQAPSEVDAIVVRIRSGAVSIKLDWVGATAATTPEVGAPAADESPAAARVPTPDATAELAAPKSAGMGSRFEVRWSGPAEGEDFISVARANQPPGSYVTMARVREGNPLKLWAPSDPGEYEVRYVGARGKQLLAKQPITIRPVTAGLQISGIAKVGGWIDVQWEGPGGEGDVITVARSDQAPGSSLERTATKQGLRLKVRAPSDPGTYEVRYILGRGAKLLAKASITVEPVTATVEAPPAVKAGAEFEVQWTGPKYPEDLIVMARANQPPGSNVGAKPTRTGSPLKLRAPKEAGTYEIRYLLGHGPRVLAKAPISVEAP
jgi:hypothetical protein